MTVENNDDEVENDNKNNDKNDDNSNSEVKNNQEELEKVWSNLFNDNDDNSISQSVPQVFDGYLGGSENTTVIPFKLEWG